jgi:uncharacterized protein with LGFP repeats
MTYTVDLSSPIGNRWVALGGTAGVGDPLDEVKTFGDEFGQKFPGGVLCYHSPETTAWLVDEPIFAKWTSAAGTAVGRPSGDTFPLAFGGVASELENGVIVHPPGKLPILIGPPIYERFAGIADLHAAAKPRIGFPLQDRDQTFNFQEFEHAVVFWSLAFGNVLVDPRLMAKWRAPEVVMGTATTGENLRDYLGRPTDDSFSTSDGGVATHFERGMLVARADGRAFVVHGPVYERYRFLGVLHGPSYLGLPESDVQTAVITGAHSTFEHGDICWYPASGAWDVRGRIRDRYIALGGPGGHLGFPIGGEEDVRSGTQVVGRMSRFAGRDWGWQPPAEARIYWSTNTGMAWELTGDLLQAWLRRDGPVGPLGFPVSAERDTGSAVLSSPTGVYSIFERGVGIWLKGSDAVAVTGLQVQLTQLHSNETFKVQHRINAVPSDESNIGTMPPVGEFHAGGVSFNQRDLLTVEHLTPETELFVWLNGIHERLWPLKDKRLGAVAERYSIDNLWGLVDTDHKHDVGGFDATYEIRPYPDEVEELDPAQTVTQAFWPFHNFKTPDLTWEQFAQTFIDVSADDKPAFGRLPQPFKWLFYNFVYRGLAEPGNCHGMCLEAIYALLRRSQFVERIYSNPLNPYRKDRQRLDPTGRSGDREAGDAINIKHGYQVGAASVSWSLFEWGTGGFRDPVRAFIESKAEYDSGNFPVLSISKHDPLSTNGHVVWPYEWRAFQWENDPRQATHLVIMVADPKHPGVSSLIHLFPKENNRFQYEHDKDDQWIGDQETGGRLVSYPFGLFAAQPSLPSEDWWLQFHMGALIVLGGDASTRQITDDEGNTFYAPSTSPGAAPLPNENPRTRMRGIVRMPLSDRDPGDEDIPRPHEIKQQPPLPERATFYYLKRRRPPLDNDRADPLAAIGSDSGAFYHDVRMDREGTYRWGYASGTLAVSILVDAIPDTSDTVWIEQFGVEDQVLSVAFSSDSPTSRGFAAAINGWAGRTSLADIRWFRMSGVQVPPGHKLGFQVADAGRSLAVVNHGLQLDYNLSVHRGMKPQATTTRAGLTLDSRKVTRLRPTDWSTAGIGSTPIHLALSTALDSPILREALI